ncbi:Uncharacterised protein [Burkholderia cenocepacia]|nr:Uncharacterised protein [Burkholderia cenocepacia]
MGGRSRHCRPNRHSGYDAPPASHANPIAVDVVRDARSAVDRRRRESTRLPDEFAYAREQRRIRTDYVRRDRAGLKRHRTRPGCRGVDHAIVLRANPYRHAADPRQLIVCEPDPGHVPPQANAVEACLRYAIADHGHLRHRAGPRADLYRALLRERAGIGPAGRRLDVRNHIILNPDTGRAVGLEAVLLCDENPRAHLYVAYDVVRDRHVRATDHRNSAPPTCCLRASYA